MIGRRSFFHLLGFTGMGTLLNQFLFPIGLPPCEPGSFTDQTDPLAMRGWREVATRVDAEDLVRRYTVLDEVTAEMIHPDHLRGQCPFCRTDWDSLQVYCHENLYGCDACGREGCVIDFYAQVEGVSYREATRRLCVMLTAGVLNERPERSAG